MLRRRIDRKLRRVASNLMYPGRPEMFRARRLELDIDEIPPGAVLVDLRKFVDYEEWHLPGAVLMDPFAISPEKLRRDRIYVFYSYRGELSRRIAEKLRRLGFQAYSLRGGIEDLLKRRRMRPVAF